MPEKKPKVRGTGKGDRPGPAPVKAGKAGSGRTVACHTPAAGDLPVASRLLLKRLSRVEGQVRGIARMVEEERYCIDILTQMAAVHEALRATGRQILENHMKSCVARAMTSGKPEEADRVTEELGQLLTRISR